MTPIASLPASDAPKQAMANPQYPVFVEPLTPVNLAARRCPVAPESAEKRILIMRTAAFGDILMATPLLKALREAYPTAHITWLAEYGERQAIDANPYVDGVLLWHSAFWKRMVRRLKYPQWLKAALGFRRELRARNFDIFISLQPEEWPLLARGTGAAMKIGVFDTFARFYRATYRGGNTRIYNSAFTEADLPEHRVDQYLLALDALGIPKRSLTRRMTLGYTAEDASVVDSFLSEQGLAAADSFAILVPCTTWPSKCWPGDRFSNLGDALAERGFRVILSGSAKEAAQIGVVADQMRIAPIVAAGIFSFRELAVLIDRASLLVSGDTGPLHAASALETPFVGLFGSTGAHWYGPQVGPGKLLWHSVPCGPCDQKICPNTGDQFQACMRLLEVDEVLAASLDQLSSRVGTKVE